jgi:hypothetical protein
MSVLQAVEAPTLSIMVPLLVRGLRHDNTTAIKRKASVIIENMAKLVDNPLDAVPFLPNLLPGLEKVANEVSYVWAALHVWEGVGAAWFDALCAAALPLQQHVCGFRRRQGVVMHALSHQYRASVWLVDTMPI